MREVDKLILRALNALLIKSLKPNQGELEQIDRENVKTVLLIEEINVSIIRD